MGITLQEACFWLKVFNKHLFEMFEQKGLFVNQFGEHEERSELIDSNKALKNALNRIVEARMKHQFDPVFIH